MLPLLKLGTLALKTLSKPVASRLKQQAALHPRFRQLIVNMAQANHQITTKMQRRIYGHATDVEIRPLNEEKAVQSAVDLIGELFVFSVAGVLLIFEVQRSARSEARKEELRKQDLEAMRQKNDGLAEEVELLKHRLQELEQLARGRGLTDKPIFVWVKKRKKQRIHNIRMKCPAQQEGTQHFSLSLSPMATAMATVATSTTSLFTPFVPLRSNSKFSLFFPTLHFPNSKYSIFVLSCSPPKTIPVTEQQVLKAIADSSDQKRLPCVRTFENDLSQLTLVGAVDFRQAVTAAAADGGEVASEHIDASMDAMVVETVFPASSSDHGTVSTRLFLPARKVKEKAAKLRKSLSQDMFSNTTSRNVLAMTFRQVVLEQIWNFDLIVFQPGEERKMEDLENPREVPASFTLSSSDEYLMSVLAEVVCISALQNTQRQFLDKSQGGSRSGFFRWFQKPERIQSKDSAVILHKLFEDEIVENAKSLLDNYHLMKDGLKPVKIKSGPFWWKPSCYEKLEKIGGSDFSAWTSEYVPVYRLEVDTKIMGDAKFQGWKKSSDNRWEVLLTHSQMVSLAETLDMYYVDPYSLPDKDLSCGVVAEYVNVSSRKGSYLSKFLSVTLATGMFLVAISALGQFWLPRLSKERKHPVEHRSLPTSEVNIMHDILDATKVEEFCVPAVAKVKDAFGWSDEIKVDGIGAWIGELPAYLRGDGVDTLSTSSEDIDADVKVSMQDIASYQVVFSSEGKIVGFQPLSRVAVNQWADNPLARELYGGKKLSPGIIEPGLRVLLPEKVIVVELLMSVKPDVYFAMARPYQ